MAYRARERLVFTKTFTFVFSLHALSKKFSQFFSKFFIFFISMMASNLESVIETPETVTAIDVHGTFNRRPVKIHKLMKPVKDRHKAGRASMIPPVLDSPSKHASLDFAADSPLPPPGRNALCSSTFPGEIQRPPSCPKGDQEPTKEATGKSMTVPMGSRKTMAPTTATHGTASLTDASRLNMKTGASRNTRPSHTAINHQARTGPVSMCLPDVSTPRSWTFSRMSAPSMMSFDARLTG
jgi:hypothetical protein